MELRSLDDQWWRAERRSRMAQTSARSQRVCLFEHQPYRNFRAQERARTRPLFIKLQDEVHWSNQGHVVRLKPKPGTFSTDWDGT